MKIRNSELFAIQADFCKVLAHPKRLCIINLLDDGERSVGQIAADVGLPATNVSQHLRVLRDRKVVTSRKEGPTVFYRLRYPSLIEACHIIRGVLLESMTESEELARAAQGEQAFDQETS